MVSLDKVTALLAKHEVFRPTAYKDTRGFLKIGYGTNLDAIGAPAQCQAAGVDYQRLRDGDPLSSRQALVLMQRAARHAMDCATIRVHDFDEMPENVQLAVTDMLYDLGFADFSEFRPFIHAIEAQDWPTAIAKMKNSGWFHQVGQRALDDIALVESANPVTV